MGATGLISKAYAYCCPCVDCLTVSDMHTQTEDAIEQNLKDEFKETLEWFPKFWNENILPALKIMTMEMTTTAFPIQPMIGAMLDGLQLNKTVLEIQTAQARIARDQIPAVSMCRYASLTKSLASSQSKARLNSGYLAKRSLERQLGSKLTSEDQEYLDNISDHYSRFDQFLNNYCDPQDFQNGLGALDGCLGTRKNRDINYNQLVDSALTLNIDYTDAISTEDEIDILAMSSNLFSHELINRDYGQFTDENRENQFMQYRALLAKRNVAEYSFNSIIGMKTSGTGASNTQITGLIDELMANTGAQSQQDKQTLLFPKINAADPDPNPSYYAQMELLTQKIFQDIRFYADLYDNPANVERQYAAMQALGLMQRRDAYESMVRSELLASLLVEMDVAEKQKELQ
jgi:hypothetical protein|tara:strand:- start:192914 stop:194122 length:1209 start_codon:yes stop_codon:yes gene_type:complete